MVWIIILFLVTATILFSVSNRDSEENVKEVSLYFLNRDSSAFAVVDKEFEVENDGELYKKVAEALMKGPTNKNYTAVVGKDVKLNRISNDGGRLTVDFSKEYEGTELLSTYAAIKTFSKLPNVRQVRITVGGMEITGSDGKPLGFVTADEINTEWDDDCATGMRLYFANSSKDALVMEYRQINITDTQPIEQYIVTELIKGPKYKTSTRLLSQDTGILSVETTDGTCYVNFKQDFIDKNIASVDLGRLIIYSIVNSLTERDNISNVQFLIDGKKTEKFGDMNISELFVRNEDLIEKL